MTQGVIIRNVTDLRAEPDFRSERKSQLLFNDPVIIKNAKNGYLKILQEDNYDGWVDEKAVFRLGKKEFSKYIDSLDSRIKALTARVVSVEEGKRKSPPYLFYGTRLHITKRKGHLGYVESLFGRPLRISLNNLIPRISDDENIRPMIVNDARRFLGTPYLWGGITPFGIDCSGLVQMIYCRYGLDLPRDSKDQRTCGDRIEIDEVKPADLLFFEGHVAIVVNGPRIIHASLAEGGVTENSLDEKDIDFRKDLHDTFLEARRVLS